MQSTIGTFAIWLLALTLAAGTLAAQAPFNSPAPAPPGFQASPVGIPHYGPARQASSPIVGPRTNDCEVKVLDFAQALGKEVGTSPWHVVSAHRYPSASAVTVWGVSLTDAYRFLVDGDRFEALDFFPINYFASSITWNLFSTDDGRVIVPDASGYRIAGQGKRSTGPSWLILGDGNADPTQSKIQLQDIIEFDPWALRRLLQPPPRSRFASLTAAGGSVPTYRKGEIATTVSFLENDTRHTYLIIVNIDSKKVVAGGLIGEGLKTNEIAAEPFGDTGTAFYVPLDETIVKVVYDARTQSVDRHWVAQLPVRRRTGSTPTLINTSDGRKFVCLIDSKCAVTSVSNGLILCSEDPRPSQLVSVDRMAPRGTVPSVLTTALPDWLRTVENSPAAYGDHIVVTNYSGYLPNGLLVPPGGRIPQTNTASWVLSPDAQEDFARGIVALRYDRAQRTFVINWEDSTRQINCIPTISVGANMVYGSGAELDNGNYWLYGYQLTANKGGGRQGSLQLRIPLGKAPIRTTERDRQGNLIIPRDDYKLRPGEVFDAGNQIVLLPDGSLILSGGRSLIRVRQR